ncbi:MAG: hypothetical protein JWL81_1616, partial [Verrucomicrobiales bacterium]|nr:hypothetical protein [Verrucomicrobiales bacterium]
TLSTRWDDPANFELFVSITDSITPALNESLRVVVIVNNLNEAPTVTGGAITVFTNTRAGTPIFQVTGNDPDRFDYPLFSIAAGNTGSAFAINTNTGQITAAAGFPTTVPAAPMVLTIRATDRATPALTTDSTVTVTILAAPAGYIPGGLTRTYFENITGNNVSNLTGNAKYPNSPDSEEFQTIFDAAEHGSNFGSTARAWLLPPATGNYTFWIASDDASVLRISTNATPASAVQRASSAGATGRYEYTKNASQQSAVIALTAGVPYYIEAQHKEGSGGDHLVVAWQGPGFSRQVISGAYMVPYLQNYAPRIAAQSFAVRRNSDVGTPIGTVNVTEINTQNRLGSYTITGGTAAVWCAIDANTGEISISNATFFAVAFGNTYTLTVRVADDANPSLTGTGTVTLNMLDPGALQITGIEQQFWTGISGNNVSALTADARYPNRPTQTRILTTFDSGADYAESYGSRIRAWVIPPTTGVYNFYVAGDDESQLRFTTGTNYATAAQVAYTTNASGRNAFTANATQKSAAFTLAAGQRYYIETRQKEGVGGDYIQVAWTGPGITTPTIIPASALAPYDYNLAPVWPTAPYGFTVKQGTPNGTLAGTPAATDADSTRLIYNIISGNTGGALAMNPYTGSLTVANKNALVPGTTLTLSLRVQDDGIGSRYPFKTATTTAVITIPRDFVIASPVSRTVNLPLGTGLEIEALGSGRAGATVAWTMVSGPGTVAFDPPAALTTGATFSAPGLYVIRGTETAAGASLVQDLTVQAEAVTGLPGGERIGVQTSIPSHTWTGGIWQLNAGGTGLAATTADSVYFINQPAGNTVTITARITAIQNVNGNNSIAGLMIRESAAADARSFFCGLTSLNGRRTILRTTAGLPAEIATSDTAAVTSPFAPTWLRITRSGNVFTAFTAPDVAGVPGTFTAFGTPQSFPMASTSFIGLAAGSGISATRGSSTFDNLTITPSLANLAPSVNAAGPSTLDLAAAATLDGTVSDDTRPAVPGAVTPLWKKISGPGTVTFTAGNAADTTATFSSSGTYQLRLTADDGDTRSFRALSVNVGSSPIESWRSLKFTTSAEDPLTAGDLADPDHDGLVNLLEYALGREPLTADNAAPTPDLATLPGGPYLRLTVARNPSATDVALTIETTATPDVAGSWTTEGTVVETNTADTLTVRTLAPLTTKSEQFLRLRVVH